MITGRELDERTTTLLGGYLSRKGWVHTDASEAFRNATRAALEVDRESLRLLEEAHTIAVRDNNEAEDPSEYGESLLRHITTLRKRLGLTT